MTRRNRHGEPIEADYDADFAIANSVNTTLASTEFSRRAIEEGATASIAWGPDMPAHVPTSDAVDLEKAKR